MTKTFTASVVALSIAISGIAAVPAQAGKNDLGKIAIGAAAALLIAKAVEQDKRRRRAAAAVAAAPVRTPHYHSSSKSVHVPHAPKPAPAPVYATPVYQPPVYQPPVYQPVPEFQGFLPTECFFDVRRGEKSRGVYSKICLGELMTRAETLPTVCEDRVTTSNGRRTQIYDAMCLQSRGYADEDGQYN